MDHKEEFPFINTALYPAYQQGRRILSHFDKNVENLLHDLNTATTQICEISKSADTDIQTQETGGLRD